MNIKKLSATSFIEHLLSPECMMLIKTAGNSIIDKTWHIAERTLPDHLIYYIEKGAIEATLNNNTFRIKEGDILWVQPGVTQRFCPSVNQLKTKVFFVRFHLMVAENSLGMKNEYLLTEDFYHLQNHFNDFLMHQDKLSIYSTYLQKASITLILCNLLREPDKKETFSDGLKRFQIIQLQKFVQKNIQKRFSSEELAKELDMNIDYFSRQFKKSFKQSPREYIKQTRIRSAAALLLESNMNISEIARFLGYQDVYQFSQQFKKVFNKSPNYYRKNI